MTSLVFFSHIFLFKTTISTIPRKYPARVFLLMGNRDINKMRLSAELSDEAMMKGPEAAFEAWWDPKAPTLMKYLTTKGSQTSWLIFFLFWLILERKLEKRHLLAM